VAETFAQKLDVIDAVEQRYYGVNPGGGTDAAQGGFQLGGFRGNPEDVEGIHYFADHGNRDGELAECALKRQLMGLGSQPFGPNDQGDVIAILRQNRANQTANAACTKDRVSHISPSQKTQG
jgi:hypothetical protein